MADLRILNLTQHAATVDQIAAGVVEPTDAEKALIRAALTFETRPDPELIRNRADALAAIASRDGSITAAMIGGAPYLMAALETALFRRGIDPVYSFSVRRSVETTDPVTGAVTKTAVFVHAGWIEVDPAK